jgi:hypothetical protein
MTFRLTFVLAAALLAPAGCRQQDTATTQQSAVTTQPGATATQPVAAATRPAPPTRQAASATTTTRAAAPTTGPADSPTSTASGLGEAELARRLASRLNGGMQGFFGDFANMFMVLSRQQLGYSVGLVGVTPEITNGDLQSPFPSFYKPTLREFLDTLALQTSSAWRYDASGKHLSGCALPPEELVIFEFAPTQREKPFQVTLAEDWKARDRGNWLMLIPPTFQVGLDIYESGTYSADDETETAELLARVPREVALEWAQRVKPETTAQALQPARVGAFDALFFESSVPSRLGYDLHWRYWVFMHGNHCYFIVSTLPPDKESELLPDVQAMLASFRINTP